MHMHNGLGATRIHPLSPRGNYYLLLTTFLSSSPIAFLKMHDGIGLFSLRSGPTYTCSDCPGPIRYRHLNILCSSFFLPHFIPTVHTSHHIVPEIAKSRDPLIYWFMVIWSDDRHLEGSVDFPSLLGPSIPTTSASRSSAAQNGSSTYTVAPHSADTRWKPVAGLYKYEIFLSKLTYMYNII